MGIWNRITGNQKKDHDDYGKGIDSMNFLADSKGPTQQQGMIGLTEKQFDQILARMPHEKKESAIAKLLAGTAGAAGKLVSVHGKKLSLEGKIINKRLYTGRGMSSLVNPLGTSKPEDPIDMYSVPRTSLDNFNRDATQMDYVSGMAMHCGCGKGDELGGPLGFGVKPKDGELSEAEITSIIENMSEEDKIKFFSILNSGQPMIEVVDEIPVSKRKQMMNYNKGKELHLGGKGNVGVSGMNIPKLRIC